MSKHDDQPVFFRETDQGGVYPGALFRGFDDVQRVAGFLPFHVVRERLGRTPRPPGIEALVDSNPINPAEEAPRGVEGVQPLVCAYEHILGRVKRVLVIAEHAMRDGEEHALISLDNELERRRIALEATRNARDVIVPICH